MLCLSPETWSVNIIQKVRTWAVWTVTCTCYTVLQYEKCCGFSGLLSFLMNQILSLGLHLNILCTLILYTTHFTLHFIIIHSIHCNRLVLTYTWAQLGHDKLYTIHYTYYTLYTIHYVQYILYSVHYTRYIFRWNRLARMYNWAMTNDALKATIHRHSKVLSGIYDMRRVSAATCIQVIDR